MYGLEWNTALPFQDNSMYVDVIHLFLVAPMLALFFLFSSTAVRRLVGKKRYDTPDQKSYLVQCSCQMQLGIPQMEH